MKSKCPECGNKFSLQEALCEDWRDPDRSHGCPQCGTYLTKKKMTTSRQLSLINGISFSGIVIPALALIGPSISSGDVLYFILLLAILICGFTVTCLSQENKDN